MKKAHYLIISFLLCAACRQHSNPDLVRMTTLIKSLDHSNDFISWQIDKIRLSLQNKSLDHRTAEVTKNWLPHADAVRSLSKEMYTYLVNLKSALKTRAHIGSDTIDAPGGWGNKYTVYEFFEKEGRKKELSPA